MFFSNGEEEKLPKGLQKELELFYIEYEKLHDLYDEGKDITKEMIECIISSLRIYLKWEKKSEKKIRDLMSEAVGEIPIMIMIDKIKLSKEVEKIIKPLVDIDVSNSNLHINRKKLILEVLKKLKKVED